MVRLDLDLVRHALQTASEHGYAEVELSLGEDCFYAKFEPRKGKPKKIGQNPGAAQQPATRTITATSVGYYRAAKIPLRIGLEVKAGDVVAEVAALGLKHEVVSKWTGSVAQILIDPDEPVEYGQPIAVLKVEA